MWVTVNLRGGSRVRRSLASRRDARAQAECLRRLHRGGRTADCRRLHLAVAAGDARRIEWRAAGRRGHGAAPRALRGGAADGRGARHAPLRPVHRRARVGPRYGSASDPAHFAFLRAYSPLHNLVDGQCYPATLVCTADYDDRVVPSHSFKFIAALQRAQGCDRPVLIRVETQGSHGYRPTDKRIAELADQWAFAAAHTGVPGAPLATARGRTCRSRSSGRPRSRAPTAGRP